MKEKVLDIAKKIYHNHITPEVATELIFEMFGIKPSIILYQEWEEDHVDGTGWSTWGWEDENGNFFDESGYELEEVLDQDKHGNITKARFKYVG